MNFHFKIHSFFAAALFLAGGATIVEACQIPAPAALNRSLYVKIAKRRIPLDAFLSGTGPARPAEPGDANPPVEPSINGLWSTGALNDDGSVEDIGFELFGAGGTHVLNDPSPILEGNVCLGAYTQVAPYTYLINHPSYTYDDKGEQVTGMANIYEKVVLDPSGNTFKEYVKVVVTDVTGKVLATFESKAVGKRVKGDDNPLK